MKDKMGLERPRRFYFNEVKIHDSKRPKPEPNIKDFKGEPDQIPADFPRKQAPVASSMDHYS